MLPILRGALAGAIAAIALSATARADEVNLIFVTVNPPQGHVNVNVFHPWAERINAAGKGIVHIDVKDGTALANFGNIYDRVKDDVIQIGWGIQGLVPGQFPLSEAIGLPYAYDNSEAASVAFWKLYKSGALDAEYNEIVPLMLTGLAQSPIHLAKPLPDLDNLHGAKIVVAGKVPGDVVAALGGTPQSIPLPDMYESIQRGTVDGAMIGWSSFSPWKLGEVTTYHVDTALGGAAGMMFMSKAKWDTLSDEAKKIIMDNSGEALSRQFGANTDRAIEEQRAAVADDPGQTIVKLTAEEDAAWRKMVEPVTTNWIAAHPGGDKILESFHTYLKEAM